MGRTVAAPRQIRRIPPGGGGSSAAITLRTGTAARVVLVAASLMTPSAATAQEEPPADTVVELRSEGTALEFIPDRLSLDAGMRVTLRYSNEGTLPHNLVLLLDDTALDAMATAAYDASDTGFVPPGYADAMIAHTPLVSPGETVEITFVVPPPGEYTYVCLFPGHANSMLGTLRSREPPGRP